MSLSRAQILISISCINSEISRVGKFVSDYGGKENKLNQPHYFWIDIAKEAVIELEKELKDLNSVQSRASTEQA